MNILRSLRQGLGLLLTILAFGECGYAQVARLGGMVVASSLSMEKSFSELALGASADPADAVCARSAVNSVVSDPPVLSSQNGVLEVTFQYQTAVDAAGLTRYCYVYTDSSGNTQEAPTLEVNPGDQLIIHFTNDLPAASAATAHAMHTMKTQATASADAACSATTVTSTSTNIHFHGTNVAPVCHQDEVIHTLIQPQEEFDYQVQIPANEPPGVYWYHPHPHGFSETQVLGGASGAIIVEGIENINPIVAGLPQRVFVLRDQSLPAADTAQAGHPLPKTDISINYVPILYPSYVPAVIQTGPSEQEFWRVLNTSADTLLEIAVMDNGQAQPIQIVSVDGVPLTDSNGNPTTTTVTNYAMSPASRIEFIVTTPAAGDTTAQLVTQTWNNGPIGDADPGRPIANIVSSASASLSTVRRLPTQTHAQTLTRFTGMDATTPVTARTLYFSLNVTLNPPQFYITLDGQTPAVFNMDSPPNIVVTEGTVEQWTIENRSTMDHNFHIHQLHFQTLAVNGVAVNDPTRRDTIDIPHWSGIATDPYPSVTLMMDFRDPNIVGTFVYHCHILSHEDHGMMGMIQVLPGATTTTLSASRATVSAGTSVILAATVAPASGSGTPTGTVTFENGSTTLGNGTLNGSGGANLATTALPIGMNTITAAYSGNNSFAASTSAGVTITVTAAATTTSLAAVPTSISLGSSVALTATVAGPAGLGTPSGSVAFQNGSTALGSATLNSSGVATLSTTSLPIGTPSITAAYAGNASFSASISAALAVMVQPPTTTTTLTGAPATATFGSSVALTATVTAPPGDGTPSGSVTFQNSGASLGKVPLNASGVAILNTTSLPAGSLAITAVFGGSPSFAASTSSVFTVTIQPGATATALTATPTTVVTGGSVALTATVTGPAGTGPPTGTVSFFNGRAAIGTASLNGSGVATLSTTSLPVGSLPITATYVGSASLAASTSAATTVTVQPEATTTALVASPTTVLSGASVAFTATVTAAAGIPQGTVNFLNGGTTVGTAALNASGIAAFTTTTLPMGTLSITAAYGGSGSFAQSTSSVATVTVQPLPPDFSIAASPTTLSMAPGGTGTSTVTITPLNGFNSTVTFTCSGLPSQTTCTFSPVSVTPSGTSTITITATIATTGVSAMMHPGLLGTGKPLYALVLPGLVGLLGLGSARKRLHAVLRSAGMLAIALALAFGLGACGGGPSAPTNPGTPTGTSTVTITASSGSTVHIETLTMTVSQ